MCRHHCLAIINQGIPIKYVFREYKRKTYDQIQNFSVWKAIALILTGFVGGIFTAIAGSGVDICSFSILSLLFR